MWDVAAAHSFAQKVAIVITFAIVAFIVYQFRFTRHDQYFEKNYARIYSNIVVVFECDYGFFE